MKNYILCLIIITALHTTMGLSEIPAQIVFIQKLDYTDKNFISLYNSTVKSKNRMIKRTRKSIYDNPVIYRYKLGKDEDIWTIIAKTGLNIDTIATLNRIDFIGMINEGKEVLLSDTLGVFNSYKQKLLERYQVNNVSIISLDDPLIPGTPLYFFPEVELDFLERIYIMGIVFHPPLTGIVSSPFGIRIDPFLNEKTFHGGVDISSEEGKPVRATREGIVTFAGEAPGYGNTVVIEHDLGYYSLYGHLKEILVEKEEKVETGQMLGRVGQTGRTTGPHLHFEIRRFEKNLNPENIPFFFEH